MSRGVVRGIVGIALLAALVGTSARAEVASAAQNETRARAVRATARQATSCTALGDFYWEIGDADGVLASGQVGRRYGAQSEIAVASASKLVFGAYVLEKIGRAPSPAEVQALTLQSGYDSFRPLACALAATVQGCFARGGNSTFTPADVGHFYYGGGHDQKLAIDLGLGPLTRDALADEVRRALGVDLALSYATPDLAGGLRSSAATYGRFLRKILRGDLRISRYLASPAVCTLPGACPGALHSPAPVAWHYGLNHWIEDDPGGDGAFSSAGAFGFYPWITADVAYYGILARHSYQRGASLASALCGGLLRRAWATGRPQLD